MAHYPPLAHVRFPGETLTHGDSDLRPERGGGLISRTAGMDALEADFCNRALLATVGGRRPAVSPEALVQSLARICGVERRHVRVEVTHPADFFITFASNADCDRVFSFSGKMRCAGAPIAFQRWHRSALASSGKLEFFCKLGIEGMPANAWECGAISQLMNNLNGQLVEILPPDDRWQLEVTAWMHNPSGIPKIYDLEVPEPVGLPDSFDEEFLGSPALPVPPTERTTLIHPLTIHVLDVVDRTVPYLELNPNFEQDDEEHLTRRHDYSRSCYRGRIDGTGRGSVPNSGGHPFCGPGGYGMAGDWGGGRRVNGVLAPAGGLTISFLQTSTRSHSSVHARNQAAVTNMQTTSTAGAGGPGSLASTVVGSGACVDTPDLQRSAASTAVGSEAMGTTPTFGKAAFWGAAASRRLSFSPEMTDDVELEAGETGGETEEVLDNDQDVLEPASAPIATDNLLLVKVPTGVQRELGGDAIVGVEGGSEAPMIGDEKQEQYINREISVQIDRARSRTPSPVRTPITVPLEHHQLVPPVTTRVDQDLAFGPYNAEEALLRGIGSTPAPSIMGPRPAAAAPARRKKTLPPNFTPRRSAWLSKNNSGHNMGPVQRAQTVLLRRMGVIEAEELVSKEAIDEYLKLFDKPLAPHHIKAVAALFATEEVDFDEPAQAGFSAFSLPDVVEPCGV